MKIAKIGLSYIGLAILLLASSLVLRYSIPYITADELVRQRSVFEWTGVALIIAFFIAITGSIMALIVGLMVRKLYMRVSLVIVGAIYVGSCLPLIIFQKLWSASPLYQTVIMLTIFLLPGIGCVLAGILFPKNNQQNIRLD